MTAGSDSKNCIVVGVDMSETGDHALRHAMKLAKQLSHSELHIAYVIPSGHARRLDRIDDELGSKLVELREHVMSRCAPVAGRFSVETVFHVRIGDPAEAIHQVAVDVAAELIVIGTHARRGMEKLILGSVAEELIRTARVGVLVAHPNELASLPRSARPEPGSGEPAVEARAVSHRVHLEFLPRTSHISGLI